MTRRPNILCFVTDQHRADHLGCAGNPDVKTPHIDRLAAEGIRFTQSFVANPVCQPNRASMFTGRYPKAHGLRENGNTLHPDTVTLPQILRENGYATASFGKLHLAPFGLDDDLPAAPYERTESWQSFDRRRPLPNPYYGLDHVYFVGGHGDYAFGDYKNELDDLDPTLSPLLKRENALAPMTGARSSWKAAIPEEHHYNTRIADEAIRFLRARDADRPFFAWCSFPDPHAPFCPPAPWCDMYDPDAVTLQLKRRENELSGLPDYVQECAAASDDTEAQLREIHAHTYGMISMVDHNIGRVLSELEEQGALEDTIIVFFSDHGDWLGDHGLMGKGPCLFQELMRVPTIWRLPRAVSAGLVSDALFSTVDLMPTLLEFAGLPQPEGVQGRSQARVLQGETSHVRQWVYAEYDRSQIPDRLRYIRSRDWCLSYHHANATGQLFDLAHDPDELHNHWDDPDYHEARGELLQQLLDLTLDADDWLPPKRCNA